MEPGLGRTVGSIPRDALGLCWWMASRKQWWKASVLCAFPSSQSLFQIALLYLSLYLLTLQPSLCPPLPSAWENPVS